MGKADAGIVAGRDDTAKGQTREMPAAFPARLNLRPAGGQPAREIVPKIPRHGAAG